MLTADKTEIFIGDIEELLKPQWEDVFIRILLPAPESFPTK